jgi:hypothetical protein
MLIAYNKDIFYFMFLYVRRICYNLNVLYIYFKIYLVYFVKYNENGYRKRIKRK